MHGMNRKRRGGDTVTTQNEKRKENKVGEVERQRRRRRRRTRRRCKERVSNRVSVAMFSIIDIGHI